MRRGRSLLIGGCLVLALVLVSGCTAKSEGGMNLKQSAAPGVQSIVFKDTHFEQFIRELMQAGQSDISPSDLNSIEDLPIYQAGEITSLEDLQWFPNLKFLTVNKQLVTDLAPLAKLKKIESIRITGCQVADLAPLQDLKTLKYLYLDSNNIQDITPIQSITNLVILSIKDNQITDIQAVRELGKLEDVNLSSNQIKDIGPLYSLAKMKNVELKDNKITSIEGIQYWNELETLDVSGNPIGNYLPLKSLSPTVFIRPEITEDQDSSGIDERRQVAAKRMMEEGDRYLDRIMNDVEGDGFTNHVMAEISYRAFLSFEMNESLRTEYEDRLRRTSVQDDNCSIFSGISKDGVHFIAVANPQQDSESYEPTINTITGNDKEYELFNSLLEPPGIADPIYYAVDLYVEDLLGENQEFEVELWEPSVGAVDYPVEHPELDANVEKILKKYNRAAPSPILQNKKWNLFLFQSYSIHPVFMLRYNGEVIELQG
ncbi:hypothetical protein PAECIP111892_04657 [Paenibacillus auburnensis]|uniref:Uncharacterized protein n=2 Tax=Paenibacillus auburnensis TaxID=2905649 RepID=A0ABM9CMZ3_9BACL|nr:hypothetical protein PAECIP111892_04657 [Paenibacillus auburnensis]